MSVFDENSDIIKQSIAYFNQLTDEEKIIIVSDLNPNSFKLKTHFKDLFPLLSIQPYYLVMLKTLFS